MRHALRATTGLALLALVTVACGDSTSTSSGDGDRPLAIATSVAPITSIVANIAGDRATVTGIVPEGTNSHTFEPLPSVAELLSSVDLVFTNGLQLELPTEELAEANLRDGAELIRLGDRVLPEEEWIYDFSFPEAEGKPNPHTWTNPDHVKRYARVVADELTEADPDGADGYASRLTAYEGLVDELTVAMNEAFTTIPAENKRLLTYHDSFPYFAQDFEGWEVIGAIQVSDFGDPSPRRVAELIDQVRDTGVPAIFGSEVFPSDVLDQIAAETGAAYVSELRDDDLPGEPGDPEHSLLGLLQFDFGTITEALGGDPAAIWAYEVRNVTEDDATYPQ